MSTMKHLFDKVKLAAGSIPNNEGEMAPGSMNMREDTNPVGGRLGAPWGQGPLNNNDLPVYSTAVEREMDEGRHKLLERVFQNVHGMASTDKGLMNDLFTSFGDASTVSHSPLLQKKANHEPPMTLAERVRGLR